MESPAKNAPCPCGSGKKYKRCCGSGASAMPASSRTVPAVPVEQLIQQALFQQQQGNATQAVRLFEQALGGRPREPMLHGLLAMALLQAGQAEAALRAVQTGLKLAPANPQLHNFLGQILGRGGDVSGAEGAFNHALMLDAGLLEAWFNLAVTQLEDGRPAQAMTAFRRVLALSAGHGPALALLAKACYFLRDLAGAEQALLRAREAGFQPERTGLWLALVLAAQGHAELARDQETQALERLARPGDAARLLVELAEADLFVGRLAEAESWLRKAIALAPTAPDPYCLLAKSRRFTEADQDLLATMEALLSGASRLERRRLEFALGKVCTDLGRYDDSFRHYQAGNGLVRALVPLEPQIYVREAERIMQLFPAERVARLPAGSHSDLPVLVVGTPRSGTTLAEMLIGSHSQARGAGELVYWSRAGKPVLAAFPGNYSAAVAKGLATGYLKALEPGPARRVVDKMPENFWYLGLIHAVFPQARIVHCTRHPIDACLSIYFQDLADAHAYKWDLDSLALWYRQYRRLMDHWQQVLPPGAIHELNYERLVDDPEGESRKLLDFLGLEWEAGVLDFHKQDRAVFTASKWQVRQPLYKASKERWRRYEAYLGPLLGLVEPATG
ncbi:MAG: sulfotransferase [Pseudomonadota bacterium]